MENQASEAFTGNCRCDSQNMSDSCFAAELCSSHGTCPRMRLSPLLNHTGAYCAVGRFDNSFAGCISYEKCHESNVLKSYFPSFPFTHDSIIIYNFCVGKRYRGEGVGRSLLERVYGRMSSDTFLLIQKDGTKSDDDVIRNECQKRVQRLLKTYKTYNFVQECDKYLLMKLRENPYRSLLGTRSRHSDRSDPSLKKEF